MKKEGEGSRVPPRPARFRPAPLATKISLITLGSQLETSEFIIRRGASAPTPLPEAVRGCAPRAGLNKTHPLVEGKGRGSAEGNGHRENNACFGIDRKGERC